jgi:hypothetical protein
MNEIWTQWKPIDGLSYGYYIDAINDTFDGFSIWLAEEQERSKGVLVSFQNSVYAYRSTSEGFRQRTISMLNDNYEDNFYAQWSFFKVENSKYLQWLSQESFTLTDFLSVNHFVFIAQDSILDIAATYEPRVELISNITQYKRCMG